MTEEKKYRYFAQLAARGGYTVGPVPVSRLPRPGEDMEDWLHEECEIARHGEEISGLIYFAAAEDLIVVSYHRVEEEEEEEEELPPPDRPGVEGLAFPLFGNPFGIGREVALVDMIRTTMEEIRRQDEEDQCEEEES